MTENFQPAVLAQPVERMAFNHVVVGSIPTDGVENKLNFFYFLTCIFSGPGLKEGVQAPHWTGARPMIWS